MPARRLSLSSLALTSALALSSPAYADLDLDASKNELGAAMHTYFAGEKREAAVFMGFGVASLAVGAGLVTQRDGFMRGAGYTLASVGVLQAVMAAAYYFSIDTRVGRLDIRLAHDAAAFQREEIARIGGVSRRFVLFRWSEIAVIVAGVGIAGAGAVKENKPLQGIGMALSLEAATLLGLDLFAEQRAHDYEARLRGVRLPTASIAPILDPRGESLRGAALVLSGQL